MIHLQTSEIVSDYILHLRMDFGAKFVFIFQFDGVYSCVCLPTNCVSYILYVINDNKHFEHKCKDVT